MAGNTQITAWSDALMAAYRGVRIASSKGVRAMNTFIQNGVATVKVLLDGIAMQAA